MSFVFRKFRCRCVECVLHCCRSVECLAPLCSTAMLIAFGKYMTDR